MANMATERLLEAHNLVLKRQQKTVLDDISLTIDAGEIVTLIGPNGCGKSTLVRILLGLEKADQGHVLRQPQMRIGFMPQRLQLDERLPLTVESFLLLSRGVRRKDMWDALKRLSVTGLASQSVHNLSGGE